VGGVRGETVPLRGAGRGGAARVVGEEVVEQVQAAVVDDLLEEATSDVLVRLQPGGDRGDCGLGGGGAHSDLADRPWRPVFFTYPVVISEKWARRGGAAAMAR